MLHVMADRYTAGRVRHEEAECGAAQRGAERLLSGDASVDWLDVHTRQRGTGVTDQLTTSTWSHGSIDWPCTQLTATAPAAAAAAANRTPRRLDNRRIALLIRISSGRNLEHLGTSSGTSPGCLYKKHAVWKWLWMASNKVYLSTETQTHRTLKKSSLQRRYEYTAQNDGHLTTSAVGRTWAVWVQHEYIE